MGSTWRALSVGLFRWAPGTRGHSSLALACMTSKHTPLSSYWNRKTKEDRQIVGDGICSFCFAPEFFEMLFPEFLLTCLTGTTECDHDSAPLWLAHNGPRYPEPFTGQSWVGVRGPEGV